MIAQHLGSLHPYEQALTMVLAFGPFVVLGIVIFFRRRAEDGEGVDQEADHTTGDQSAADQADRTGASPQGEVSE
ncbi:MAG: hypothetical protein L0H31_02055 [Nocardioidaceae bacterium]|nr:hypothetical protein [Nocardioidaceae bacterium]